MELTMLAAMIDCQGGDCPEVYKTDRGDAVVRGYVVTDPAALAKLGMPAGEAAVVLPFDLLERAVAAHAGS